MVHIITRNYRVQPMVKGVVSCLPCSLSASLRPLSTSLLQGQKQSGPKQDGGEQQTAPRLSRPPLSEELNHEAIKEIKDGRRDYEFIVSQNDTAKYSGPRRLKGVFETLKDKVKDKMGLSDNNKDGRGTLKGQSGTPDQDTVGHETLQGNKKSP
ncbi:hypothetical protein HDE_04468 [Halotydeus destructor]|nr:hypothetical protein HDE_04468 [Halotydeus destructor]